MGIGIPHENPRYVQMATKIAIAKLLIPARSCFSTDDPFCWQPLSEAKCARGVCFPKRQLLMGLVFECHDLALSQKTGSLI